MPSVLHEALCCYDLLQMRYISRYQLLAAFLRSLSPFLMDWDLQFSDIYGFACCCCCLLQIHQRFSVGLRLGDCDSCCRIFQDFWNQVLVDFAVCLGSLYYWNIQWIPSLSFIQDCTMFFFLGFPDSWLNPSYPPHAAGFQWGCKAAPEPCFTLGRVFFSVYGSFTCSWKYRCQFFLCLCQFC